ncbi:MAG: exodeoxyribonuclease V subunit alpha [Syntrophaceae bacterium]|nr:exodeoxyribonuclease V subunit alpha [Syntrophaceae bacterium]
MMESIYQNTIHERSPLARHFADFMVRLNGVENPELYLAAHMLCEAVSCGHICLKLDSADEHIFDTIYGEQPTILPDAATWGTALRHCKVVGQPGDFKPLILDEANHLYTYRYWQYEHNIALRLQELARERSIIALSVNSNIYHGLCQRFFSDAFSVSEEALGPAIAAFIALTRNFCFISGSPGTGKTTAVARILAFLLESTEAQGLRIALSAPTAKAAVRLQEAISKVKRTLPCSVLVKEMIPEQAMTIHRLLGSRSVKARYVHHKDNPLPFDIVVVDEASMIDLPLMSHLLDAIPQNTKLILLGDPYQLSSVEAGAVLGDIRNAGASNGYSQSFVEKLREYTGIETASCDMGCFGAIQDCMVALTRNYRFREDSPLGHFRRAVIDGNIEDAFSVLNSSADNLDWFAIPDYHTLKGFLENQLGQHLRSYVNSIQHDTDNMKDSISLYEEFRVLCAVRGGLCGTVHLNRLLEKHIKDILGIHPDNPVFPGKAVMVTQNDYSQQLFNGDIGLFLPETPAGKRLSVFFRDAAGEIRKISPYALPEHETAFALTVHKSQGSEYERVFLFLPEVDSPILSRELLYTGITRARKHLTICGSKEMLMAAISRKIVRHSGLTEKILDTGMSK